MLILIKWSLNNKEYGVFVFILGFMFVLIGVVIISVLIGIVIVIFNNYILFKFGLMVL